MDSDEPQHLHVAWGWAHGLLQYRDVFDNHTPLFHMLCGPLVALVGDRADLLIWMRLAMLPVFALALAAVYWIGRAVFSVRVGLWAAVWIAVLRPFFVTSVEFRADDLWMAVWLLAVAVLVRPPLTVRRSLAVGLLLGAALAASLKTGLMMPCLLLSAAIAALIAVKGGGRRGMAAIVTRSALAGAVGMAIVPGLIVVYFAARSALAAFQYGVLRHNSIVTLSQPLDHWPLLVGAGAVVLIGCWALSGRERLPGLLPVASFLSCWPVSRSVR